MNNIDFVIDNDQAIMFDVQDEQNIVIEEINSDADVDINIGNNEQEVDMDIQSSSRNIGFDMNSQTVGTNNYKQLVNKPSINSVVLIDNKTSEELGLQPAGSYANSKISNLEIDALFR